MIQEENIVQEKMYGDKTVLVYDFGSYIDVAQRLSRDFGRVLYFIPSITNGFKDHKAHDIGRGVEGIERVEEWEDYYEQIDLFVFTDIYAGALQDYLRRNGKRVFGSGKAGRLETDRLKFKQILAELELPVNGYDVAYGVYDLEEKLKNVDDRWIKSELRGDMESWHHTNYTLSKSELKRMKHDMGIYDKQETYIIDSPIEAIAEIGYDGFCIDGAYPERTLAGIECKDMAFLGRMTRYRDLPEQVTNVNDRLAPLFQSYGYRGAFSSEVRVTKERVGYMIDTTIRFTQPPTSLTLEMYENYSEIIWQVAGGIIPKIKYKYDWGVQLIIKSEQAKDEPTAITFPEEFAKYVKIKNLVVDEGVSHYTPNNISMTECGAIIGMGHSMEEALKMAKNIADTVKGHDLKINADCLEDAKKQMGELRKYGIRFI